MRIGISMRATAKGGTTAVFLLALLLSAEAGQCPADGPADGDCPADARTESPGGSLMLQSKARTRMLAVTTSAEAEPLPERYEVWPGQRIVEMELEGPHWADKKMAEIELSIAQSAELVAYERRLGENTSTLIIGLLKDLFEQFKNFDACLSKDPNYKVLGLWNFFSEKLSSGAGVVGVAEAFWAKYMQPAVDNGMIWINDEIRVGFAKVKGMFQKSGGGAAVIGKLLDSASLDAIPGIIDEIWAMQMRLLSKQGYLPVYCIQSQLVQPYKETIKTTLSDFLTNVVKPVQKWVADMMEALGKWMTDTFMMVMQNLGMDQWDTRLAEQVKQTAAESCTEAVNTATADLETAAKNKNIDEMLAIEEKYNAALPGTLLGRVAAAGLSLLLNDIFGWIMRTLVEPAVEWMQGGLQVLYNEILHVINGLVGLAPFAGDAISAAITASLEQVVMFINQRVLVGGLDLIKQTFKYLSSYKTLEPPMVALFEKIGDVLSDIAGAFGDLVQTVLAAIGITDTDHWIASAMNAIVPAFEKVAELVMPKTKAAMQDCIDARKVLAGYSRKLVAAFDPSTSLAELEARPPYEGDHPYLLEMADAFHQKQLAHNHWIYDIPCRPTKPEHIAAWERESTALLQEYDDYIANYKYSAGGIDSEEDEEEEEEEEEVGTQVARVSLGTMSGHAGKSKSAARIQRRKRKGNSTAVSTTIHWDSQCHGGAWQWDESGRMGVCHNRKCTNVPYYWNWKWNDKEVCVDIPYPCWVAGWKHMGAKACQYGTILGISYWWCPKAQSVGKLDFLKVWNFRKCLDDENWLDQIILAAKAMPNIWEMAKGLLGCLGNMNGEDEKWKVEKVTEFYIARAADPLKLLKDMFTVYVKPTLDPFVPWIKDQVMKALKASKVLLDAIGDGNLVDVGTKFVKDQILKGYDMLTNEQTGLMSLPGMGPAVCVKRHFIEPVFKPMLPQLIDVVIKIVKPLAEFVQKILKQLMEWMNNLMKTVMEGDSWFAQLYKIVQGSILETCLFELKSFENQVAPDDSVQELNLPEQTGDEDEAALLYIDDQLEDADATSLIDDDSDMRDRDNDGERGEDGHSMAEGRWGHRHNPHHHNPHNHNPHNHNPHAHNPTEPPTPMPTPAPTTPMPTPVPTPEEPVGESTEDQKKGIDTLPDGRIDILAVGFNIVLKFLRKAKDWIMSQLVAPVAKEIAYLANQLSGLILHGADALMGLIPFAGGLIGAIGTVASDMSKQVSSWFSFKSVYGAVNKLFEIGLEWVQKFLHMLNIGTEKFLTKSMEGPFGVVVKFMLDMVQKAMGIVGGPLVRECQASLKSYVTMTKMIA